MPGQSYGLEDGSCSYKDFSESRNNRFSTPEQAAKNRIQHPSNVLHFFNAPLEVTEENFFEVGVVERISRDIVLSWVHLGHSKNKTTGQIVLLMAVVGKKRDMLCQCRALHTAFTCWPGSHDWLVATSLVVRWSQGF